jgi:hypothetical protein
MIDVSIVSCAQVQIKKDYYKPYHAAVKDMLLKPIEHEIYSRMPGNEWSSVKQDS